MIFKYTGVEDKESWHGKPLPKNMAEQVIQEIEDKIQNKKKLSPALPEEDAPVVNIRNIKMPSPPTYKVGEKVLPPLVAVCQLPLSARLLCGWQEVLHYPLL